MTHGNHIGNLPQTFDLHQMADLHRRGYDTISSRTYRILVSEGIEPTVFRTWGPSQVQTALDDASLV